MHAAINSSSCDSTSTSELTSFDSHSSCDQTREESIAGIQCSEKLYSQSKKSQEEGKKRREAIALASLKRNKVVEFGVLPASQTDNMFLKGVAFKEKRKKYLEQRRIEEEKKIQRRRIFLASKIPTETKIRF